ncbi:MAG: helix-turn-helix domain-containing protein [Pelagimonas sp.]|jgi:arsenate reductase|nr:helix-turn-helix domain-containing protein [Pelagimonas sp.]
MSNQPHDRLACLGHPQRLAIFRLLMRRYPDRLPAGEIARVLDLPASTLSAYLSALMQAGLITQQRAGTTRSYAIEMENTRGLFDFLLLDCCRGRPEICTVPPQQKVRRFNVLFLCTGNSARSIMAESLLRDLGGDRFVAYSAGTQPFSELNPTACALLRDKGHDIRPLRAKHVDAFRASDAPQMDFVFTVCDRAANEDCPAWPGQPISGHWGLPDPVKAQGSEAARALAFQDTYGALRNRIQGFVALPFQEFDRLSLQQAVDQIGQMNTKEDA